jgi:hypothetical protein
MNLIRKLGFDFFNEKFSKGIYILNGSLYLALHAMQIKTERNKEKQKEADLFRALRGGSIRKRDTLANKINQVKIYTDEAITAAYEHDDWDEEEWESIEDFMYSRDFEHTPEWLALDKQIEAIDNEIDDLRKKEGVIRAELQELDTFGVQSIDFANKKIVTIPENEFQSIRMFWDFPEGYRVLRTWKSLGQALWLGPTLNGARCIKLERQGYRTTSPDKPQTEEDLHLANYGFYLEEDRWKDILFPQGVPIEQALEDLEAYKSVSRGSELSVLLEGNQTTLRAQGDDATLAMTFQSRTVAMLNYRGEYEKVKKGMLAIAEKQGVLCRSKK